MSENEKGGVIVHIGIIGTGHMGGMLATAFCEAGTAHLFIHNRTKRKAQRLEDQFPMSITLCDDSESVVEQADVTFLCTNAKDLPSVLTSIRTKVQPHQYIISINSHYTLRDLEAQLPCKVAKVIPSITQTVRSGILLFMPGNRLTHEDEEQLLALLRRIGEPHLIEETQTRVYSDLTSCGPAFIAYWLLQFTDAAKQHGVPEPIAQHLLAAMAEGVGRLITEKQMTLQEIITRVAVPGGITEAGLHVLEATEKNLFIRVLEATQRKQENLTHSADDTR
ncbi:pyrroline-5-carboxylate reductase dimerization domain-containing protein [Sulfoacidibacillus thermotolerans]|uniref:pyrroline-5-carboxylate reductase dimerization domain-containing protein n=1 Tax=Sulfoacidibacillus thermotolerans TaxID=1765684 RepID=UPI000D689664|nr:pyrroline-5-carboxylate reductase dimerization domain-containing protein [Sulfoacidibacillus thermotolerans]